MYRLNRSGSLDPTFALGGARPLEGMNNGALALALQPDGKVLAAGYTSSDAIVYRLNADGTSDQSFDEDGVAVIDSGGVERVYALALQPDGKILVSGETDSTGAARPRRLPAEPGRDARRRLRHAAGRPASRAARARPHTRSPCSPTARSSSPARTTVDDNTDGIVYR